MSTTPHLLDAAILIVDDNAFSIDILHCLLSAAGYTHVERCDDARSVGRRHHAQPFDLIVLDINMPNLNGFDVMAQLKQIDGDDYLPVLVVSGDDGHRIPALQAGARDFICKPFDHAELLTRIENTLDVRLRYTRTRDQGRRLACYDPVTGLPNRLQFERLLSTALLAPTGPLLVMLVDLDHFNRLNDIHGFAIGDEVLRQSAARLALCAPPGTPIARLSNDAFALMVTGPGAANDGLDLAQQIIDALAQPFHLCKREIRQTASIGIAHAPGDSTDAATLVQYAGTALHQGKQRGDGACRFFTDAMNVEAQRRFELEDALRHALQDEQFELYYQPKVQIGTGCIVGAEALLRWNRPGHGVVSPSDFIPLLETTGLIVPVGAWAIDEACRQIAVWSATAPGAVPVAVNVASRQFTDGCLEVVVAAALARHGINAALLGLEVTESALMDDTEVAVRSLAALRAMGVRLSIDDFGTGYSSLAYLKRFPVDVLKIDIAFIRDVTTNADDAALVDAIIAIGHSLQLEVIAEGVETPAQLAYLGRHRCDQIQGYLFSPPIPAAAFAHLLRDGAQLDNRDSGMLAQPQTLLIVDDEECVRSALCRMLRCDGYRILSAPSAQAGLEFLAANDVHVILCDQRMPGMSGTEFFDIVKDMYPDTLRIILSGYTELDTILDAINRGALYRFYLKPWDNTTLRDHLRAAFRHYWQQHGTSRPEPARQCVASPAVLASSLT